MNTLGLKHEYDQHEQYEQDFEPEEDDANLDNEEIQEDLEIEEDIEEGAEDEQINHPDFQQDEVHSPDDINLSLNLSESSNSGLDTRGRTDEVESETEMNEQTHHDANTTHNRWNIGERRSSSDENLRRDLLDDEEEDDGRELAIEEQNAEDDNLEEEENIEQEVYPLEDDLDDEEGLDRRNDLDDEDIELDLEAENVEINDQDVWSDDVDCIYSSNESPYICGSVKDGSIKVWKKQGLMSIHNIDYPLHGNDHESFLSTADSAVLQAQRIFMTVQQGNSNSTHDTKFDIIVGYENGTLILLFQIDEEASMKILRGHADSITAVAGDEDWIYSSSRDNSFRIWNTKTHEEVKQFREAVQNIAVTDQYVLYTTSNSVKIRNKTNFDMIASWNAHSLDITGLEVYQNCLYTSSNDASVKMWDIPQITAKNSSKKPSSMVQLDDNDAIVCMKLSLQGSDHRLVCAKSDGKIFIWNATVDQQTESEDMYENLAILDMTVDNVTDGVTMIYALMSDYTLRAKERPEAVLNVSAIERPAEEEQVPEVEENGEAQYDDDFESAEPTPRTAQATPRDQQVSPRDQNDNGQEEPEAQEEQEQEEEPVEEEAIDEEEIPEDIPEDIDLVPSTKTTPRNPETPVATPRQISKNGGPHNTSILALEESFEECLNKMANILDALPHEDAHRPFIQNEKLKSTASTLLAKLNIPSTPVHDPWNPSPESVMHELQKMEAIVKKTSEFLDPMDESLMLNESIDIDSLKNINTSMVKTISNYPDLSMTSELRKTVNDNILRCEFLEQTDTLLSKMTESIQHLTREKKQYMDQIDMQYKTIHEQAIQIETLGAQNTQLRINQENINQQLEELKKENESLSQQVASKAPQDMLRALESIKQEQAKTLQEYSGFIQQIQAQNQSVNKQLEEAQKDLRQSESHLSETQSELSETLTKLRHAELVADDWKLKHDTARDQVESLKLEMQAVTNERNNYKTQCSALQAQNSELVMQSANIQDFEDLSAQYQQLQESSKQTEIELTNLREQLQDLTTKHENLQEAHTAAQQQSSENEITKEEKVKQLETELTHISQLESKYKEDIQTLQKTLQEHQTQVEDLTNEKSQVAEQFNELKQQHQDLTERHEAAKNQTAALERHVEVLKARSQGTDAQTNTTDNVAYDELEKLYQRVYSERNELETELEHVKKQLEVFETRYEQEIKGANVDTSKIITKEQYNELLTSYNEMKTNHEQAMTVYDQLKHDYAQLYSTHNETFTRYSDSQNQLAAALQDCMKLEETNAGVQEELQDVNYQLEELREEHRQLQEKMNNADDSQMIHVSQYQAVKTELDELKELYQNIYQERNDLQDRMDQIDQQPKQANEDTITELEQMKNQYQRISMQLEGLQSEHTSAKEELEQSAKDLEESRNQYQQVSSQLETLLLEHKDTTQLLEQATTQLEEMNDKQRQLSSEHESLQLEHQDTNEQLVRAIKQLEELKHQHKQVSSQMESLQLGNEGSSEQVQQLTEELEAVKNQYQMVSSQLESTQQELDKVKEENRKESEQSQQEALELTAERSQANTKIQILEETIEELTNQLDSQKATLTQASNHVAALDQDCNHYLQRINELESKQMHEQSVQTSPREDVQKMTQSIRALEQNNQVLKSKLDSVNQKYAELNEQLIQQKMDQQNNDEQILSLEEQKEELERLLEQAQNEMSAHKQKAEDHIALSQQQASQIESLESHINSIQEQYKQTIDEYTETYSKIIVQKDSHIASVEQSLELLQKEFQSLKRDYDSMKFQYDELGTQYDTLQEDYDTVKVQLQEEKQTVTVEVVEQQKMEMESLRESHEEELARIRAQYEEHLQAMKEDSSRASENTEQLEERLHSLTSQFEDQIRFSERASSEKDQFRQMCEEYAAAVESLKAGLEEAQQKQSDYQRALKQLQQEKQNLQDQLMGIQQQKQDLQQYTKSLQDQKQDLQEQLSGLKNSPVRQREEPSRHSLELQNQLTQWQSRVQILEDFNDRLTQQNYQLRNDLEQERKQFNEFLDIAGRCGVDENELSAVIKNIDKVCQQQEMIKAKLSPVTITDNFVETDHMHKVCIFSVYLIQQDLGAEYLPSHKAMSSLGESVHYLFDVLEANYEQLRAVLTNQVSNNSNFKKMLQSLKTRPPSNPNTPQKSQPTNNNNNNNTMYSNHNTSGNNINTSLNTSFQHDPSDEWSYVTGLAREQQQDIMDLIQLIQGAASEDAASNSQQSQLKDKLQLLQRQKVALEEELSKLHTSLGMAEKQLMQQQSQWKQKTQLLAAQLEQKQSEIDSLRQSYEDALFSLIEEKDIIIKEREIEREKFKRELQNYSNHLGHRNNMDTTSSHQLQQLSVLLEERQKLEALNQRLAKKMEDLTMNYNNMLHFFKEQLENVTQKNAVELSIMKDNSTVEHEILISQLKQKDELLWELLDMVQNLQHAQPSHS